ncbi:hypothetical protein ACRRTK_014386 [Alexandromys fortis]
MKGDRDRDPHWSTDRNLKSKSGAEGERAQTRNSGPRGVHPHTETMGMFYRELTKALWPGAEKAWDKTGLAEHSGQ